jgi:hypothetical protein
MNEARIDELMNKIKDEKLRKYLKGYSKYTNPSNLLGILDYLNFKLNRDSIDAIIPQLDIDRKAILLGGIILHGKLFRFELRIHDGGRITLEIYEGLRIILYEQKEGKEGKKDEEA